MSAPKKTNSVVCVDEASAVVGARTLLQRAIDEQRIRAETIRHLILAFDEQQRRLDLALQAVGDTEPIEPTRFENGRNGDEQHLVAQSAQMVVRCLGSLEVTFGRTRLDAWRSGKARALFEYLIAHRSRPIARETLIQALWPDPDALAAGTSLKVAVHALRQMLSELTASERAPLTVVVRESSYELKAANVWVDVEDFERCCRLAGQLGASGDAANAQAYYSRAAELYQGDFLEDSWDDWAVFRREGLKDQYLMVLAQLADAAMQAGDYDRCVQYARRLLEEDSCREDTYRMLMICHARLGQPGRVRRWYQLCVKTIFSMLDSEPDPETERIYRWASTAGLREVASAHRGRAGALAPPVNPSLTAT